MRRRILVLLTALTCGGALLVGMPSASSADGTALAPIECEFTVSGSSATVSWTRAVDDGAASFVIRRSRNGGAFGWTGRVVVPATTFTQTVPRSSTYAYTVEAKDAANQSSEIVACTEQTAPDTDPVAPLSCTAERTGNAVTVEWTRAANDNASAFIIRRSRDGGAFGWTGRVNVPATTFDQTVSGNAAYDYTVETRTSDNDGSTGTPCINSGEPPPAPGAPTVCTYVRDGNTATLEWTRATDDNADAFIIRRSRNGGPFGWTGRILPPDTTFTQTSLSSSSTYDYRVETRSSDNAFSDPTPCTTPQSEGSAERVLHISIDGLRSDYVNDQITPTLWGLVTSGASTLNARTDFNATITLPNHTGQLTSRRQLGPDGFNVLTNEDNGGTVHDQAGFYVASSFDVAHDNGLATYALVGKEKFDFFDRTWNEVNGAPDTTGADDGMDKIDVYEKNFSIQGQTDLIVDHLTSEPAEYIFWHIPHPDGFGHPNGWGSPAYDAAVANSDASIAAALNVIANDPALASTTAVIVTSDHGGPIGESQHDVFDDDENFIVPFIVWGPGVGANENLYTLNSSTRLDPGIGRPDEIGIQPIRASEAGNLSTQLLGLSPIPGSRFNAAHDLVLD